MITIRTYDNVINASIAKGFLESEGIACKIKNADLSQLFPITQIELAVNENDAERAKQLLSTLDN